LILTNISFIKSFGRLDFKRSKSRFDKYFKRLPFKKIYIFLLFLA
jgi:hypothetical protein